MKTVSNSVDLRRLAARTGATAQVGGQVINAQGARLRVMPVAQAPAAEAAPRAPQAELGAMMAAIEKMGQTIAEAVRPTAVPQDPMPPAASPPTILVAERAGSAEIIPERDDMGLMTAITVVSNGKRTRLAVIRDGDETSQITSVIGGGLAFKFERDKGRNLVSATMTTKEPT